MRTTKELLEVMLQYQVYFKAGLCQWINRLYSIDIIDVSEYKLLYSYIQNHELEKTNDILYWWPVGELQPRIDWINEQIKLLSE
jgi:hypothetical protein